MGKKILISLAVAAFMAITASLVFAGSGVTFTHEYTTVIGGVIFTPSTKVNVNAMSTNTSGSPPNQYCVTSWHASAVNQSSGKQYAALSRGSATDPNMAIVS